MGSFEIQNFTDVENITKFWYCRSETCFTGDIGNIEINNSSREGGGGGMGYLL